MKPVRADFIVRTGPSRVLWGLLLCSLLVLAFLVVRQQRLKTHFAAVTAHVQEQKRADTERATREQLPERAAAVPYEPSAREMLAVHLAPWPAVLAALETTPRAGVVVNAIEFDSANRAFNVEATADDHRAIVEYLEALNAGLSEGERVWRWTLLSAQRRPEGGIATHLRMTLRER